MDKRFAKDIVPIRARRKDEHNILKLDPRDNSSIELNGVRVRDVESLDIGLDGVTIRLKAEIGVLA